MAGAATAEAASPTPVAFRNSRRFMAILHGIRRGADSPKPGAAAPPSTPPCGPFIARQDQDRQAARPRGCSSPRARTDHEGVESVFGDLPPQILIAAEGRDGVIHRLEIRIS